MRTGGKAGRPSKPVAEVKRAHLTFRVRDALRDRVAQVAAEQGRSISEEIEHRLERSFHESELRGNGVALALFAEDMCSLLRIIEITRGRKAFGADADAGLHRQLWMAFHAWFRETQPPAGRDRSMSGEQLERDQVGAELLRVAREACVLAESGDKLDTAEKDAFIARVQHVVDRLSRQKEVDDVGT